MRIPLFDTRQQNLELLDEVMPRIRQLFEEGDFILGRPVKDLEKDFAKYLGVRHAIGVNSGTDALLLSLRALDIMPGDEVLVPAFGPISLADVVARVYATPVFVDIEPHSYGLDPTKLQEMLSDKTRAIIVSHQFGQACAIDQIHQFAQANNLPVIEDCSQALGGTYMGRKLGTHGTTGCFSFNPTRNLGAAGDAGMVTTDNDETAERLRRLRDHGRSQEMVYDEFGYNTRLDSIQAILLMRKLEDLDESNDDRIENARLYERLLDGAPLRRPRFVDDRSHVYSLYAIEHQQRDQLAAHLAEKSIGTGVYYPLPLHLQPCFEYLDYGQGSFPVAEAVAGRILALPVHPGLKKREIEEVAAAVKEFFSVTAS